MCQFISFFHRPDNGDIAVYDLQSHGNTEEHLKLNKNLWAEGHYTPKGELILRQDGNHDQLEIETRFKNRFPNFVAFAIWCFRQEITGIEWLDLSGLTSAEGLVLPAGIETLDLSGLTSAEGLVLPAGIKWLNLGGLTSAEGLVLPAGIKWLHLSGNLQKQIENQ